MGAKAIKLGSWDKLGVVLKLHLHKYNTEQQYTLLMLLNVGFDSPSLGGELVLNFQ